MDQFIQNQLKLAGCEHLISLFRDQGKLPLNCKGTLLELWVEALIKIILSFGMLLCAGYNEESYRNLGIRTLMQILPADEDEDLALKLMNNIKLLKNPNNANGMFPSPSVMIKVEQPHHDVDDDVE